MSDQIVIRSPLDRLRFSVFFEITLIGGLTPLLSAILDKSMLDLGLLALVLSLKAMTINFIYNYIYDRIDVSYGRIPTERSLAGRICHALGFEILLTCTSLPIIVWWLNLGWIEALIMDIGLMITILFYTMLYTWVYDQIFPVKQPMALAQSSTSA